jgi:hypothetical protein
MGHLGAQPPPAAVACRVESAAGYLSPHDIHTLSPSVVPSVVVSTEGASVTPL